MVARVKMILVFDACSHQFVVELSRSFFKTVVIVLAAVEIDGEPAQVGRILLRQKKWTVCAPVSSIDRGPKNRAQHTSQRRARLFGGIQLLWRLSDKRSALSADG